MGSIRFFGRLACLTGLLLLPDASFAQAGAQHEQIVRAFAGDQDGSMPTAGIAMDSAGNLYGTTISGGHAGCSKGGGCGTLFKIAPDGTESVLLAFDKTNGSTPQSVPFVDSAGNITVTTIEGGSESGLGHGTLARITPDGQATILYSFCQTKACPDGGSPIGGLIADKAGDLFGVAYVGGPYNDGVIFEFTPDNQYNIFYAIGEPLASGWFARDSSGNFYVVTSAGGANANGTVLKVSPHGAGKVFYQFGAIGKGDGAWPTGVTIDKAGNLYGFTAAGGSNGAGTVFTIDPKGAERVLYSFSGGNDGASPSAAPILDKTGNIYGVASAGGTNNNGTAFELSPDGALTVLYDFTGAPDGAEPRGPLLMTKAGALYGTTQYGGTEKGATCRTQGCGTVFVLKK